MHRTIVVTALKVVADGFDWWFPPPPIMQENVPEGPWSPFNNHEVEACGDT